MKNMDEMEYVYDDRQEKKEQEKRRKKKFGVKSVFMSISINFYIIFI